jgi:predicted RND superfamily exporter protein
MWHRIAAFIIKFRIALLLSLLGATVLMGYFASKVELSYEFTSAIPTDNPKYIAYQEFRKQFGEDGNLMVIGIENKKFFQPEFFKAYAKLVKDLEKVKSVENVLSIPGAINLVKDTATSKLKTVKIFQGINEQNFDSLKNAFYNLPFYKGFLYNEESGAYLMALRIDKRC